MTCQLGKKKHTPKCSQGCGPGGGRGKQVHLSLYNSAEKRTGEGREARPASSRPLLFPRTQSSEAQGTAGAGEQHGSRKESGAMEKNPPLTTNLGENGDG